MSPNVAPETTIREIRREFCVQAHGAGCYLVNANRPEDLDFKRLWFDIYKACFHSRGLPEPSDETVHAVYNAVVPRKTVFGSAREGFEKTKDAIVSGASGAREAIEGVLTR